MDPLFYELPARTQKKKMLVITALAVFGVVCVIGTIGVISSSQPSLALQQFQLEDEEFKQYLDVHGKSYETVEEYTRRFQNFRDNSALIRIHNSLNEDWTLGHNQFSDLSFEEFRGMYLNSKINLPRSVNIQPLKNGTYPAEVDFRIKGAVTAVKNQGQCGSCWAFSTTGSIEGAWALAGHTLVSLSEQELVDCSTSYGNQGCNGGLMDYAFQYVIEKGITTEANYPYLGKDGKCDTVKAGLRAANVTGFVDVVPNNYTQLLTAVAQTPVSVAVEADQFAWQLYRGGVVTKNCGTSLDHGVLIVGYDINSTPPYWIVKNSWGPTWGEEGYIRLGVGTQNSGKGVCGINMNPSFPISQIN